MKVGELHGYTIEYNTNTKQFEAWKDGEIVTSERTQAEVEEFVEKLHKKGFQRVKAIRAGYGGSVTVGEITSIQRTAGRWGSEDLEAWFVWKDERNESRREKIRIGDVYQATPENLKIAEKMTELSDQRGILLQEIEELKNKLTNRITKENIYKLAGLE